MNTTEITNHDNIIDSRDVIDRIDELEAEAGELDEYEEKELKSLRELKEQYGTDEEWESGMALINNEYFEDYARDFAEGAGYISNDSQWPFTHIDWEEAAEDLKQDYNSIDFDGTEYWVR